ncbi:MAG TPA: sigma-54 dependent transcriptional regulator [Gallionella sp.]|nr:sigma-54 dependent transcriptional regulator [Gallionella sp.]
MIVDDDPLIREGLAVAFGKYYQVHPAESRAAAIERLRNLASPPQLALVDLGLPPLPHRPDEGFHLIAELIAHSPDIKIFVLTGQDDEDNARHARALGAMDFIAKPCAPERIREYFDAALRVHTGEENVTPDPSLGIVGQSLPIRTLRDQIAMYAPMPFPVLIEGESGCGKELVAAALQRLAGHPGAPFRVLNCAAISPTLIEATLFGHSKGAYTGANNAQSGFFEDAADGTLFLDEIGELPLELQAKLLRILENGEYQRVGETTTRKSRARIIAATNRNLRDAVKTGTFRDDLYHRLNVFRIAVPPLRELGTDRLVLLNYFRTQYAQQLGPPPFELHPEALQRWERYGFPGNTRELRNIVIRLSTKYPGQTITPAQLEEEFDPLAAGPAGPGENDSAARQHRIAEFMSGDFNLDRHLHEIEADYIGTALELASGNISEAAKLLGINRTTLHSRIGSHEKFNA